MIILNNINKIDILYRNYIKQFSKAYIKGSILYVGESLKNVNIKSLEVENIIKRYKKIFIDLYMNNNKIYDEVSNNNLCVICLENLNENIKEVCHKCNVKCHIKCLYNWYEKNNKEVCPICLKTEDYYLNILKGNDIKEINKEENSENVLNIDLRRNHTNRILEYIQIEEENTKYSKLIYCMCMFMFSIFIIYINSIY